MPTSINVMTGQITNDPGYVAPSFVSPAQALEEWRDGAVVSRFQALAALMNAGMLTSITTSLETASPLARLAWAEAAEFRRRSPLMLSLAAGLGLTDTQLDGLFQAAILIKV